MLAPETRPQAITVPLPALTDGQMIMIQAEAAVDELDALYAMYVVSNMETEAIAVEHIMAQLYALRRDTVTPTIH